MYYTTEKRDLAIVADILSVERDVTLVHEVQYRLINVVAMGTLELRENSIDLTRLEGVIETKAMDRFPCVMFKVEGFTILLFKNGKLILTGVKDPATIPHIKCGIEGILAEAGITYDGFEIVIQNLVAMANLGKRIDLELACLTLENCLYEPEQFPAAIVRNYRNIGGVFLIFSNSKIICLGIHDQDLLDVQFHALVNELYNYDLIAGLNEQF